MNRFPNWLRWLLFLPLSIIASILVFVLVKLVTLLFDNFFLFQLLLILPGSGLTGYILVAGAAFLVPKLKVSVSILMAISYGLLSYFIFIKKAVLVNLIQLNSFEMICLTVLGTMAAIFASYQGYANEKKLVKELIDLEREKQIQKALENERKLSDRNSDILEDSIFQIITEFDTKATKPKRKIIGQDKVSRRSSVPAKSPENYQNDSIFRNAEDDIIISDRDSDELEKEISQVMNVLDTDIAESEVTSVSKQAQSSRTDRGRVRFDVPPVAQSQQKRKKKKYIPLPGSRELDQQISEIMSDIEPGEKAVQKKAAPEFSRPISPVELEKSSDTYSDDGQKKDFKHERPVAAKDFRKREEEVAQPRPKPAPERMKSKPDDLPEKKEIDVPVLDSKDSARETGQPPIEPISKMIEPEPEISSNQDQLDRTDEVDKLKDLFKDTRQKQHLKDETEVARKDSGDEEKKVLPPQVEAVPDKAKSKRDERLETDRKHVTVPGRKQLDEKELQTPIKSVPKIKKQPDIPTDVPSAKESMDQKLVPGQDLPLSEKKPPKAISKLSTLPEKPKTKLPIAEDDVISLADLDRLIEYYQDESLTEKPARVEDIPEQHIKKSGESEFQDAVVVERDGPSPQVAREDLVPGSHEPVELEDTEPDEPFSREFSEEDRFSYLNLEHLDESVIQTTTELDILIRESKTNRFMNHVENYYKSVGEDENIALIHTEIFYLWCMMEAVFEFSMDSEFRKNLIMFFNTRVGELYLKWKEFTNSNTTPQISIDFNNFSYYSNQVRTNKIHLNSSFQNTDAEILFGKIVLTKIHECIGNKKVDVERETILMPVQVYYELKQRVVEILNRTTNMICY